jgi:hypothetical protein
MQVSNECEIQTRTTEAGKDGRHKRRIVLLNLKKLKAYFTLPLNSAAESLGISITALKWYVYAQL